MTEKNSKKRKSMEIDIEIARFVDRLSALPDTILIDILSHIPTKTAISTSVLSTRWRYLWTQLNHLCLDNHHFPKHIADFYPVIDKLLTRLTSPLIHTFSLQVPYQRQRTFERWLRQLSTCSVQNIDITLGDPQYDRYYTLGSPFALPLSIFLTKSLKSLILPPSCLNYELPNNTDVTFELPNLIKLELSLRASECGFVAKLVRSCPLLGDLQLSALHPWKKGSGGGAALIDISSDKLKRLKLNLWYASANTKVVIDVPELNWFYLHAGYIASCSLVMKHVPSLQEVSIYIIDPAPLFSLLPLIRNVRSLSIYAENFGMLESFVDSEFNSNLLRCDELETLTLGLRSDGIGGGFEDRLDNFPFRSVSPCLLLRVKNISVVIHSLTRADNLKKLAKFLLCKAPHLETLTFHLRTHPNSYYSFDAVAKFKKKEMSFCIDLYSYARKSSKCRIEFQGQHARVPSNDVELEEMKNHHELLRKFLSLQKPVRHCY